MTVTFWWPGAVLLSATLLTTCLAKDLFSLFVLFCQCRSCDNTVENCPFNFRLITVHMYAWFMKIQRGKFPEIFIGKTQSKSVYSLKPVENSIKVLARAMLKKVFCSSLVALTKRLFTHRTILVLSAPRWLFYRTCWWERGHLRTRIIKALAVFAVSVT